ncbi:MAG: hypothetical protein GY746_16400 [Gammaproteobacteria bacterium]|nr:hypothetical protein [Gammaproteobacteria bacterium]
MFTHKIASRTFNVSLVFALLSGFTATSTVAADLSQVPLFLVQGAKPLVMLNMSNDHQLFYKAYDDYSDLDDDDVQDTSYKNSIDYYGYFDSYKCYTYTGAGATGVFEPAAVTTDKYCDAVTGDWSGNFLNWATMTRIDVVRKILYGGSRSTDNPQAVGDDDKTILERAFIPGDAHSFVKYFATTVAEMEKLTPWSVNEISLCNTTYVNTGLSEDVDTTTKPPLIRVASGNFELWTANERYQCHWRDSTEAGKNATNANNPTITGLTAHHDNPSWTGDSDGLNGNDKLGDGDYTVRVEVCKSEALKGTEKCQTYPDGNLKPIGLLQEYGEDGEIEFGLMTGSFQKNKSGGVLRKNIGDLADEIIDTNGKFKPAPAAGNIIKNIDALRVSGYKYGGGQHKYNDSNADDCPWAILAENGFNEGKCSNWGNPQAEIFLESLRYLAGKSATPAFDADDSGYIDNFNKATSWSDPLSNDNYCAPANIIQFNASSISYDGDSLGGSTDVGLTSLNSYTKDVGDGESITGNDFFVGKYDTEDNGLCTAKTVNDLSLATGICPEKPRLDGTYQIAGLAYYAHKDGNTIRTGLTDIDGSNAMINVNTFGVTLAPAVPNIRVPIPGGTKTVTILPACRSNNHSSEKLIGNCAIVDFKVVIPHNEVAGTATGMFYVNWEDSEQGGDYDQDMTGVMSYSATSTQIQVTTRVFQKSTPFRLGFGYVISGTTKDGFHVHSGANSFDNYTDPDFSAGTIENCGQNGIVCSHGQAASTSTYTIADDTATLLKDPLWYASKWGGFEEESNASRRPSNTNDPDGIPNQAYEWDLDGDEIPDSYFYSTDPSELNTALGEVFEEIAEQTSSSASVASNSQRLNTGTNIFQAQFNSEDWSGNLIAIAINMDGSVGSEVWSARDNLEGQDWSSGRNIFTYDPVTGNGKEFTSGGITSAQLDALHINPDTGVADTLGEERVEYIRGSDANEVSNSGPFRDRSYKLGDLISSAPVFVGAPAFGYPEAMVDVGDSEETYATFAQDNFNRSSVIYVGGNDGMLHAISATTVYGSDGTTVEHNGGDELMAYVPGFLLPELNELTSLDYDHRYYVDGSPTMGDVFIGAGSTGAWHTVLAGGARAGGQGYYLLDITDPSLFTQSTTNATNLALWEFTDANDADLGYSFSQPAIAKMKNGKWAVIFGNGYNNTEADGHVGSGTAVLFIVYVDGSGYETIDTGEGSTSDPNGLSTPAPVDVDGDSIVDYIYAGDLYGNMWKFDVTHASNTNQWEVDFGGDPLFTTLDESGNAQPITVKPDVGLHPLGGYMVYFGTGKFFEVGDNNPDNYGTQTFWAVRDNGSEIGSNRDNFQEQEVTTLVSAYGWKYRITSNNGINWGTQHGWYMDLPEDGEQVVVEPQLNHDNIIFVTQTPSSHQCGFGGSSWLMEMSAVTGGWPDDPNLDINGDGVVDDGDYLDSVDHDGDPNTDPVDDVPPTGRQSQEGILTKHTIISAGTKEHKYSSGSKGGIETVIEAAGFATGRQSWEQIR